MVDVSGGSGAAKVFGAGTVVLATAMLMSDISLTLEVMFMP